MGTYSTFLTVGEEGHPVLLEHNPFDLEGTLVLHYNSGKSLVGELINLQSHPNYVQIHSSDCTCREVAVSQLRYLTEVTHNYLSGYFYPILHVEILNENGISFGSKSEYTTRYVEKIRDFDNKIFNNEYSNYRILTTEDNRVILSAKNHGGFTNNRILYNISLLLWVLRNESILDILLEQDWSKFSSTFSVTVFWRILSIILLRSNDVSSLANPVLLLSLYSYYSSLQTSVPFVCNGPVSATAYIPGKYVVDYVTEIYMKEFPDKETGLISLASLIYNIPVPIIGTFLSTILPMLYDRISTKSNIRKEI